MHTMSLVKKCIIDDYLQLSLLLLVLRRACSTLAELFRLLFSLSAKSKK